MQSILFQSSKAKTQHKNDSDIYAYAKTVIELTSSVQLRENDIVELAQHIGVKLFPRHTTFPSYLKNPRQVITGLPDNWVPSLNEKNFSLAYHNPDDFYEYIAVAPSAARGARPHIIHYTSDGHVSPAWFNEILPKLYEISCNSHPSRELGKFFKNQQLTLGQINTIHHFFKADPILKIANVCLKCYKVSLPNKGFGVKFLYQGKTKEVPSGGIIQEIRFSARKTPGTQVTSRPYVTELVIASPGMNVQTEDGIFKSLKKETPVWTMLDSTSDNYRYSTYVEREETHIDAALYDFDKLTMRFPVCHCGQ